jgi:hypothetical protein
MMRLQQSRDVVHLPIGGRKDSGKSFRDRCARALALDETSNLMLDDFIA